MLGQVSEVVRDDSGDCVTVRFSDRYEWIVNVCACQLVDAADISFIHTGVIITDSSWTLVCVVAWTHKPSLMGKRQAIIPVPGYMGRHSGRSQTNTPNVGLPSRLVCLWSITNCRSNVGSQCRFVSAHKPICRFLVYWLLLAHGDWREPTRPTDGHSEKVTDATDNSTNTSAAAGVGNNNKIFRHLVSKDCEALVVVLSTKEENEWYLRMVVETLKYLEQSKQNWDNK